MITTLITFQFCINAYGGNSHLQAWDNTLLAAIEFDVHQVIRDSRYQRSISHGAS